MKTRSLTKYLRLLPLPTLLCGIFIAALSACGPSAKELALRAENERRAEAARVEALRRAEEERAAAEAARQAKLAARQKAEADADEAARTGKNEAALDAYIALLNESEGDAAEDQRLREKIITFVVKARLRPAVPEEARRHAVRAQVLIKTQQNAGFAPAAVELAQATSLAPWWADAYYNLGLAQEGAADFGGAMRSLKLCLLADPESPNAVAIQNKIYELEVAKEQADKLNAMNGTWRNRATGNTYEVSMRGKDFEAHSKYGYVLIGVKTLNSIEGTITVPSNTPWQGTDCRTPQYTVPMTAQLTEDGKSLTIRYMLNNYEAQYMKANGSCVSVTLAGSNPDSFTIVH